jgi:hypothetical protein
VLIASCALLRVQDLIENGVYSTIATPLKGGTWRKSSIALVAMALSSDMADTLLRQSSISSRLVEMSVSLGAKSSHIRSKSLGFIPRMIRRASIASVTVPSSMNRSKFESAPVDPTLSAMADNPASTMNAHLNAARFIQRTRQRTTRGDRQPARSGSVKVLMDCVGALADQPVSNRTCEVLSSSSKEQSPSEQVLPHEAFPRGPVIMSAACESNAAVVSNPPETSDSDAFATTTVGFFNKVVFRR